MVLLERPALPIGLIGGWFITALANIAISVAASWVMGKLFEPEAPEDIAGRKSPSSVYNLNNSQNQARLGEPIPVIYGTVRLYPSYIAQPYFKYIDNDEYLYHLMCVGQGKIVGLDLMIGDQVIENGNDVYSKIFWNENFSDIEGYVGDTNYNQLTNTLVNPSRLEMGGFWADDVDMTFSGSNITVQQELDIEDGSIITIDENIGGGTTPANTGDHTVISSSISSGTTTIVTGSILTNETLSCLIYMSWESEFFEVNLDAKYVETDYSYPNGLYNSSTNGDFVTYDDSFAIRTYDENKVLLVPYVASISGTSNNPIRKTVKLHVLGGGVKYVTYHRTYGKATNSQMNNTVYIDRVKELFEQPDLSGAGDITLMWVRVKATNAISSMGQQKINGHYMRNDLANDMNTVLTDIYTNTNYGGRLNANDLDFPVTTETVNGAFDSSMTVFDAMKSVSKSQKYTVFLAGMDLVLKKDGTNDITSGLYNETNIIRGSLSIQYIFEELDKSTDSYECSYRDEDWNLLTKTYPSGGVYPSRVDLFGVAGTGADVIANDMAKYLYKQDGSRRKIIRFNTDIQGLVPLFLDKILISHNTLMWGEAGEVYSVDGSTIEVSMPLDGTENTIVFRNIDGSVSNAHSVSYVDEYHVSVSGMDAWVESGTFYTVQGTGTAKEFIVVGVKPAGEQVSIECVNYDASIYS